MAEALVLLGLAANIFQFVEQGTKVITTIRDIAASAQGCTTDVRALRLLAEDAKHTCRQIPKSNLLSKDEIALQSYAAECGVLTDQIEALLSRVTTSSRPRSKWKETIKIGVWSVVKEKEIEKLGNRLKDLHERLQSRLSSILDEKRHSSVMTYLADLDRKHTRLGIKASTAVDTLRNDLVVRLDAVEWEIADLMLYLHRLMDETRLIAPRQRVVESLLFAEIKHRHSDIEKAHAKSLLWLFEESQTSLASWLKSGGGIYWVAGLAGSGKSTMMKYLSDHPQTHRLLALWAGENTTLVTASFFFWNQGSVMQKSLQGLLQSILFQIIRTDLRFVPLLFPGREDCASEPWTVDELLQGFLRVSSLDLTKLRFCFFIDGLDEYDGDESDVIRVIRQLQSLPGVKICASSRPWNAFKNAFHDPLAMLVIEKYTSEDIRSYIDSELSSTAAFRNALRQDGRCKIIINQLTERAQGVWLWVYLIVRGLQRDISSNESFEHLQRRVNEFPSTLKGFFRRVLHKIDPIYSTETARILLLLLHAEHTGCWPLSPLSYFCVALELSDPDYALKEDMRHYEPGDLHRAEILASEGTAVVRINDRCKDLVRVRHNPEQGHIITNRSRLDFLHRTVRDFLRDNMYGELTTASQGYSPPTSLARAYTYFLKKYDYDTLDRSGDFPTIAAAIFIARDVPYVSNFLINLAAGHDEVSFDTVDEFMTVSSKRAPNTWIEPFLGDFNWMPAVSGCGEAAIIAAFISLRLSKTLESYMNKRFHLYSPSLSRFKRDDFLLVTKGVVNIQPRTDQNGILSVPLALFKVLIEHGYSLHHYPDFPDSVPVGQKILIDIIESVRNWKESIHKPLSTSETDLLFDVCYGLLSRGVKVPRPLSRDDFTRIIEPVLGTSRMKILDQAQDNSGAMGVLWSWTVGWVVGSSSG